MTRLYLEFEDKTVVNNLQSAYFDLDKANRLSIDVPSEFQSESRISDYLNDIRDVAKRVENLKDWYRNSQRDFELLESDLIRGYGSLSDKKIVQNKSIVK